MEIRKLMTIKYTWFPSLKSSLLVLFIVQGFNNSKYYLSLLDVSSSNGRKDRVLKSQILKWRTKHIEEFYGWTLRNTQTFKNDGQAVHKCSGEKGVAFIRSSVSPMTQNRTTVPKKNTTQYIMLCEVYPNIQYLR